MSNLRSRVLPSLLAAALVAVLAACGGGSSDADATASSTSRPAAAQTTTTEKPTTTTTEAPKADPATRAEAASRVFDEGDFPEGWTVAVKPLDYAGEGIDDDDDCTNPDGGPLSKIPLGAAAGGPTMRAPGYPAFISSWAATFEDEAQATAFSEQVATPEHAACTAEALQAAGGKGRKDYKVTVTSGPPAERGVGQDHRVAADSFEISDGGEVASIVYTDTFQVGRTVVTVNLELGPMTDEQGAAASAVEAELRGKKFA
ncbi:MAG: hypothetical protein JWO77_1083 [Ilumatobacteraceae bacterium]|nr:hypothetical protein [Ilumatobacteraceae bacterium]